MMRKIIYIIPALLLFSVALNAQTRFDALRWSQNIYNGTARFSSMGGAFTALGGDFASLSTNPAGVGVYRTAEVAITPSSMNFSGKSSFDTQPTFKESKNRGDFNFGYVQPFLIRDDGCGLISVNIGIGLNTMQNFNMNTYASNKSNGSWLDAVATKANSWSGFIPSDMEAKNKYEKYGPGDWDVLLAWNNKLIDKDSIGYYANLAKNDVIEQRRFTKSKGSNLETVFSIGGNVANKLYFGVTLGSQDIDYRRYVFYDEDVIQTSPTNPTDMQYYKYAQYYKTEGTGYNAKFGVIYRPQESIRLGISIHTPTWMRLTDYYQSAMKSKFKSDTQDFATTVTPTNSYDYKVTTPAKYMFGFAYIFETYGLVSIDYEFVDYSTVRMKDRYLVNAIDNSFRDENNLIKDEFKGTSNIKIGAEGKIGGGFSLRAGYAFYQSPYKNYKDADTKIISVGAGYRTRGFYADIAYKFTTSKLGYTIYKGSRNVTDKYEISQVLCTLGFRF